MEITLPTTFWGWVQFERSSLWDAAVKAAIAIVIIMGFWLFSTKRLRIRNTYLPLGVIVYAFAFYLFVTLRPYFSNWQYSFAEDGWKPFIYSLFLGGAFLLIFLAVRLVMGWILRRRQPRHPAIAISAGVWIPLILMRLMENGFAYTVPKSAIEYHITEYSMRYWGAFGAYAIVTLALLAVVFAVPALVRKATKKCVNCLAPSHPEYDTCPICGWGACQKSCGRDILSADTREG